MRVRQARLCTQTLLPNVGYSSNQREAHDWRAIGHNGHDNHRYSASFHFLYNRIDDRPVFFLPSTGGEIHNPSHQSLQDQIYFDEVASDAASP
mmetsp:Transcript_17854/g.33918  ORF Transcript_17854/g.33918 Transcript_17854/m.33918 type:complete len:93 (+) Transcript_17854:2853-3131(+)